MEDSSSIKPALDRIERPIAKYLKSIGFVKKGRTFNRPADDELVQVVDLQSGSFPIGQFTIPESRESCYGNFTVNLGVAVPEIFNVTYPNSVSPAFWKEYQCTIRTRLGVLLYQKDYWWEISGDSDATSQDIIEGLKSEGASWFDKYCSHEKVIQNYNSQVALRADLDIAIITFHKDHQKGEKLLREYYSREHLNRSHNEHVKEVAGRLGIPL